MAGPVPPDVASDRGEDDLGLLMHAMLMMTRRKEMAEAVEVVPYAVT